MGHEKKGVVTLGDCGTFLNFSRPAPLVVFRFKSSRTTKGEITTRRMEGGC